MSEEPSPAVTPGTPAGSDADQSPSGVTLAGRARLADTVVGHLADQARRTASAAKARRVVNDGGEPGMLDLTPLRELFSEFVAELGKLRPRERIARALRQAADVIDSQTSNH